VEKVKFYLFIYKKTHAMKQIKKGLQQETRKFNNASLHYVALLFFILQTIVLNSQAQNTYPCLVNTIEIGTGINWAGGVHYTANQSDQYWAVTGGTTTFNYDVSDFPRCAKSHGWSVWTAPHDSRVIAYDINQVDGNFRNGTAGNCHIKGNAYVFQRRFKITLDANNTPTTANIDFYFDAAAHGYLRDVYIVGPGGYYISLYSTNCANQVYAPYQFVGSIPNFTNSGIYTIVCEEMNDNLGVPPTYSNAPNPQYFASS
jgi:hypothetical protein